MTKIYKMWEKLMLSCNNSSDNFGSNVRAAAHTGPRVRKLLLSARKLLLVNWLGLGVSCWSTGVHQTHGDGSIFGYTIAFL